MKWIVKITFGLVFVLTSLSVCAQFSTKLPSIKLSTHPKANAVIYILDSVKFYFDRAAIIKLLKKDMQDTHYNAASDSSFLRILRSKSYNRIAIYVNDTIYQIKAGAKLIRTNNSYWITYLMTYLLFDGKLAIYLKQKHFINKFYYSFYDADMDIKGPYIGYSIYAPNGWLIEKSRAYNEKLDFLMEKKF